MELRWYQKEACEAAWNYLCSESGNPAICLPTGSGKSLVIAELARKAVVEYGGRVLILQHRKELISQNTDKVKRLVSIPVGEYSAGLRRFATSEDIVLCGIQSVYNKSGLFDQRNLIIIDEVHLVPSDGEGMYLQFLNDMRSVNQNIRCIGLTATPFRTGEGALCKPNGVFQKLCYDASVKRLIDDGFLCRVTNKPSATKFDTSNLHMRYGEFIAKEVEQLFGGSNTAEACKEIVSNTIDRNSVMVFCSSVKHAESVVLSLRQLVSDRVEMVEGGTSPLERTEILTGFKEMAIRYLVNVDVLTTGFDAPCVDSIAILRATASPGLFAQIVGRGLRTHQNKTECLVLDFGGNIQRHGPIDDIEYGKPKVSRGENSEEEELTGRECPNCTQVIPIRKRKCDCGFQFPPLPPKHETTADTDAQIISEPEVFPVASMRVARHTGKEGKQDTLRVDYMLESDGDIPKGISEWVCLEHVGFARTKAVQWWNRYSSEPCPDSIDEAIDLFSRGWVAVPKTITARREGKFWRITDAEIEELPVGDVASELVEEEMPF